MNDQGDPMFNACYNWGAAPGCVFLGDPALGIVPRGTGVGVGIKPAEEYHHLTGVAQEPTNSQMGLTTSTNAAARDDNSDGYTDDLDIRAIVVSLDGQQAVEAATQRRISSREDAEEFGIEVARMLVEKGAGDILKEITLNRHIIEEQKNA